MSTAMADAELRSGRPHCRPRWGLAGAQANPVCVHAKSLQWCLNLCDPMDLARQAPLSMGFSRQEYWSGLPCPPSGDLSDPWIKPVSSVAPELQANSLLLSHWGSPGRY